MTLGAIDKEKIEKNLELFENLSGLGFNIDKIVRCGGGKNEFVLKHILLRADDFYWRRLLSEIDGLIKNVSYKYSRKKLRDKLTSTPFSTKWELELANLFFIKNIDFTPEHTTSGNSNVDFEIKIKNKKILIEAYLKSITDKDLKEFRNICEVLYACLIEKTCQNAIPNSLKFPLIIAIDNNYLGYLDKLSFDIFFSQFGKNFSIFSGALIKKGNIFYFSKNPFSKNSLTKEEINKIIS